MELACISQPASAGLLFAGVRAQRQSTRTGDSNMSSSQVQFRRLSEENEDNSRYHPAENNDESETNEHIGATIITPSENEDADEHNYGQNDRPC